MIEHATIHDLDAIFDVESRSFERDPFSRRSIKYLLTKAHATTLVERQNGILRGYAMVLYHMGRSQARLYSVGVLPEYRGKGLGTSLLHAAEQDALKNECVSLRLEVRQDNPGAIKLYRKYGYNLFGVVPDYYLDNMTALRFEKALLSHPNL